MERHITKVALYGRIVGMSESGISADDIAEVGVHRSTVYKWLNRWEEEGELTDLYMRGARRKMTAQQDQQLRKYGWSPISQRQRSKESISNQRVNRNTTQETEGDGLSPYITGSKAQINGEAETVEA
ncbi:hypothetical protein Pcinc_030128 [Petrolisthes cinctipes]|uniref:Transposase n=1 Tax=Petrolisthes cinctipes TaxID=88211 RepID=A0AAE1K6F0_PETCI|nr:hypothetical protein Pcinc_030128 [Petrolisthes cinctipes]